MAFRGLTGGHNRVLVAPLTHYSDPEQMPDAVLLAWARAWCAVSKHLGYATDRRVHLNFGSYAGPGNARAHVVAHLLLPEHGR